MKKSIISILLAAVMILSLCACGGTQSSTSGSSSGTETASGTAAETASKEKVVFTVQLAADPIRIDPAFAYDNDTSVVIDSITEGLLTHNPDNSLKCCLCESWEATDELTYVYHIRQDVNFSDGKQMTVDDVVYSLQRHMDDDLGSYMNWFFDNVESIEATGDWDVTVKLAQPDACWQYVLATSAGMIIEKEYAESCGADLGSAEKGIIGTGPFVYDSWTSGSKVILKKNENYWDKTAKTNIDEIVLQIITDDTTLATAMKSEQLDFAPSFSDTLVETLDSYENVNLLQRTGMGITYLAFNNMKEPFNDVNARYAVQYAIPIDEINDNIVKTTGIKGGLLPMTESLFTVEPDKWQAYVEKIGGHVYDVEKAKEYLAASAYPDGFSFDIIVSQSDSQRYNMALVVQEALKAINVEVNILSITQDEVYAYQFGEVTDENGIRDYDCLLTTWGADYPDPSANLTPLYNIANIASGGYNCAAYSNETVDRLLTESNTVLDDAERMQMLFDACDIIVQDRPYYVLKYSVANMAIGTKWDFGDMNIFSAWDWNFRDVYLK